jgi:preprotein translocase subunit YajC
MSQYGTILYFAVVIAGFYLLFIRPQMRRNKEQAALLASLEVGDQVITAGGLYGTIKAIDGDVLKLEIAEGIVVRVLRGAVSRKLED